MNHNLQLLSGQTQRPSLGFLEEIFLDDPSSNMSFFAFINELLETPLWVNCPDEMNIYRAICLDLAREIDVVSEVRVVEPAFHSRLHFKDVCLAISLLIGQDISGADLHDESWSLSNKDAWILLLSAIGHDFGHRGGINQTPFEQEAFSIKLIQAFFLKNTYSAQLVDQVMSEISPLILATEPAFYSELVDVNTRALKNTSHENHLAVLLVEADLMASILPEKGELLSTKLGLEWQSINSPQADLVASTIGRLEFLNKICFMSPMAKKLGLETIRQIAIERIRPI